MKGVKGVIQMIDLEVTVVNNDITCLNGSFCMVFVLVACIFFFFSLFRKHVSASIESADK